MAVVVNSPHMRLVALVVAVIGMFASSPMLAGPDEPAHLASAWYDTERGLPPTLPVFPGSGRTSDVLVPELMAREPCYVKPPREVACLPERDQLRAMVAPQALTTYAPLYYWMAGAGERLAAATAGPQYSDLGGRLAGMVACLALVLAPVLVFRRRRPGMASALLAATPPMSAFLWAVVNPSGWEVAAASGLGVALGLVALSEPETARSQRVTPLVAIGLAALLLATARPIGWIWVVLLSGTAILLVAARGRSHPGGWRTAALIGVAILPAVAAGVIWSALHPSGIGSVTWTEAAPGGFTIETWVLTIIVSLPYRIWEMFGWFGWLDARLPIWIAVPLGAAWITVGLRALGSRREKALATMAVLGAVVVVPSVLELAGGGALGDLWWQGRYTLPFMVGMLMLVLARHTTHRRIDVELLAVLSTYALAVGIVANYLRFAYGTRGPDEILAYLEHGALSPIRTAATVACVVALGAIALAWTVGLARESIAARRATRPALPIGSGTD